MENYSMGKWGLLAIGIILIILIFWGVGIRNHMVDLDEEVYSSWAQVQNQYQRRYDLIPNLVETVKGFAAQEKSVLLGVTEARAKAGGIINVTPEILNNPQAFAQFQQVQEGLGAALQRLMVVIERYPELKSDQNFLQLQAQLEGTENRISVERRRFNEQVQKYNKYVRTVPNNLIAGVAGFQRKAYFQAVGQAEEAPKVQF
jgi:LemA protein